MKRNAMMSYFSSLWCNSLWYNVDFGSLRAIASLLQSDAIAMELEEDLPDIYDPDDVVESAYDMSLTNASAWTKSNASAAFENDSSAKSQLSSQTMEKCNQSEDSSLWNDAQSEKRDVTARTFDKKREVCMLSLAFLYVCVYLMPLRSSGGNTATAEEQA
jgi:hypothetical protein